MNEHLPWIILGALLIWVGAPWLRRAYLRWRAGEAQALPGEPDTTAQDASLPEKPAQAEADLPATAAPEPEHEAAAAPAAQQDAERLEAEHQQALTAKQDQQDREDAARRNAERAEAERLEAERQLAVKAELARQEAAREEAERVEAERLEAERQRALQAAEQARQAAARREAERVEAERAEAERQRALQAEAAVDKARRDEADRQALASPPAVASAPRLPAETRVLVADDSKVVRVKTSRLLLKHGYQVTVAEDGSDAARQMAANPPHVLITDVEMPGMDGFELSRHVRGLPHMAHIPIIMVTAAEDKHASQAALAGVSVLLGKPYRDEDLIAHVESSLAASTEPAAELALR